MWTADVARSASGRGGGRATAEQDTQEIDEEGHDQNTTTRGNMEQGEQNERQEEDDGALEHASLSLADDVVLMPFWFKLSRHC